MVDEQKSMKAEIKALKRECTAWRVTAENAEAELKAIKEAKPEAWMHTMDNTEGIRSNNPQRVLSFSRTNPFGVPGVDYSKSYPVTSKPLYAMKGES